MATSLNGVSMPSGLIQNIRESKVLVVGAGGIGCELLKNLVLSGFNVIELIDLDTIDVSNLNRQFLFRKEHVGKSKSKVAKESVLKFNPDVEITAYHDSILSPEYDVDFFKRFSLVMNALDNYAARKHVNRMCLAADVPLVESGSAGYLGQVTVIKKNFSECYECQPRPPQKTFASCTIRNTPSELIHCVVWAKHLFNQLFGEEDSDQDVSPDTQDPELSADVGMSPLVSIENGGIVRKSTRVWAYKNSYDPHKMFNKFFNNDIRYLLSMDALWKTRQPPQPLSLHFLLDEADCDPSVMSDQRMWSVNECYDIFARCLGQLGSDLVQEGGGGMLVWDKDYDTAMDFVACVANIRAFVFGIAMATRFEIKSMAGNIIPAIATTNAVIAGLIVMEAMKILCNSEHLCRTVYLNSVPNNKKRLLVPCSLDPPNPKCFVCAPKPELSVLVNCMKFSVGDLEKKVLKAHLGMVAPDVEIDDGKGTIIISSEEGETEDNNDKLLSHFNIRNGTQLKCDDFLQVYCLVINIVAVDKLDDDKEFEVIGNIDDVKPNIGSEKNGITGGQNTDQKDEGSDDDVMLLEHVVTDVEQWQVMHSTNQRKRKISLNATQDIKRSKMPDSDIPSDSGDAIEIL